MLALLQITARRYIVGVRKQPREKNDKHGIFCAPEGWERR
jgi:hypothetical protein